MPETFLNYLRNERRRLDRELERALTNGQPNRSEVGLLQQQRRIVDDQLARWSNDLLGEQVAA